MPVAPEAHRPAQLPLPFGAGGSLPAAWGYATLFLLALLVYLPTFSAGFVWNDPDYVTRAGLRSWGGLWRIWFEVGATEQYYPLLHSAFWFQHRLWGDHAGVYHFFNTILHAGCACLLVAALRRLLSVTGDRFLVTGSIPSHQSPVSDYQSPVTLLTPWLAGLLFVLHPVYVESVAWISEQKNTQSTLFYLAAAWVYLRWRANRESEGEGGKPNPGSSGRRRWLTHFHSHFRLHSYLTATALFACALLSKSVTASLPAALLVVLWWRRGRLEWRADVLPLLPWFAMGAGFGLFSAWVEHNYIGATGEDFALGFLGRGVLAGRIIWFYLAKFAWPYPLIFIYPRWEIDPTQVAQWIYPVGAIALLGALWWYRGRNRGPLAAYLFFVGTLFPTGGFFNVFGFTYSYVADHWQYLPSLGPLVLAATGLAHLLHKAAARRAAATSATPWEAYAVLGLLVVLGVLSWRQTRGYRDIETFYRTILAQNPACWMASANLAILKQEQEEIPEAIALAEESLRVKPDNAQAMNTLGIALTKAGRRAEALAWYEKAVARMPQLVEAHYNLGHLLILLGRDTEGLSHYRTALHLRPTYFDARKSLATEFLKRGDLPAAIEQYQLALKTRWGDADAHFNLGNALLQVGQPAEALRHFEDAVQIKPTDFASWATIGDLRAATSRPADAIPYYEAALKLDPTHALVRTHFAIVLARLGRIEPAVAQVRESIRLEPGLPVAHWTLANLLAQAGQLAEAIPAYETFLRLNPDSAEAHNNLGTAYRQLGNTVKAIAAYEAALRINPGYSLARENLARLRP